MLRGNREICAVFQPSSYLTCWYWVGTDFLVPILSCDILIDWSLNTKLARLLHFVLLCCQFWNTFKRISECYNTDGNDTKAACANDKKSTLFSQDFALCCYLRTRKIGRPVILRKLSYYLRKTTFVEIITKIESVQPKTYLKKTKEMKLVILGKWRK